MRLISSKLGSADTTNAKQPIIFATLSDIEKEQVNRVQLSSLISCNTVF